MYAAACCAMNDDSRINDRERMKEELATSVRHFEQNLGGSILGAFAGEPRPTWFNGDKEKTLTVLHSLLAKPDCNWAPASDSKDCALLSALRNGNMDAARLALIQGANPNCDTTNGGTPLSMVAGDTTPIKIALLALLLESGANPNQPFTSSWTPLACASYVYASCTKDPLARIKLLLAKGARMQISTLGSSRGLSPLSDFYGDLSQSVPVVQFLLSYVAPEDVALLKEGKATLSEVTADIIETKKLLLATQSIGSNLGCNGYEKNGRLMMNALSIELFEEHYKDAIIKNIKELLETK